MPDPPLPHGKVRLVGGPRDGEIVSSLGSQYLHFPVYAGRYADMAIYQADGTFVELRPDPQRAAGA